MKKLLFIVALFFFLLTGCEKVGITPVESTTQVNLIPTPEVNAYYTITNTETDWGVIEYRVQYIDCNGKSQDVPLLMQESITVCLKYGVVTTNFAYSIKAEN